MLADDEMMINQRRKLRGRHGDLPLLKLIKASHIFSVGA
jgi:hypothetical protein